ISIAFIAMNGKAAPSIPYITIFLRKVFCGGSGLNLTPLNDKGISAGIIIALKINVDSIAVSGLWSCMIFSICSLGLLSINMAGRIAKYLAASLAILKVVIAPRV